MTMFFSTVAICGYMLSGIWIASRFLHQQLQSESANRYPLLPALIALLGHALLISPWGFDNQIIDLGFFTALSVMSWVASLMVLLFAMRRPVMSLGLIIFPFSALSVLLKVMGLEHNHLLQVGIEMKIHILLSIIAFSLLVIASVQAILFAIQERHLRNHKPNRFVRQLPPMEAMESFLFQVIRWGFVALTLAIFNGILFLDDMFKQHMVHKSVLSVTAWLIFAVLLWGRMHYGWRGRTAIRWTLSGFVLLLLAYFGSKMVQELILQKI